MQPAGRPMLIFDGDCGFCTASATWLSAGWGGRADAVPWQQLDAGTLTRLGVRPEQFREAAWWQDESGAVVGGHLAIAGALRHGSGWRRHLGRAISVPFLAPLTGLAYRLVARNRYRLPGGSGACRLPFADGQTGTDFAPSERQ